MGSTSYFQFSTDFLFFQILFCQGIRLCSLWRVGKEWPDIIQIMVQNLYFPFSYCENCFVGHCLGGMGLLGFFVLGFLVWGGFFGFEEDPIIGSMYEVMRVVSLGCLCVWRRYREAFPWGKGAVEWGFFNEHLYLCSAGVGKDMKWYQWWVAVSLSFVSRNNSWYQKWKKFPCLFSLHGEFYTKKRRCRNYLQENMFNYKYLFWA